MEKFKSFYTAHKDRLFSYLLKITGDYHLAADIMQESFTRYLERYGKEGSTALLYTIARNAVIDTFRRQDRGTQLLEERDHIGPDQEANYLVRDECRRLLAALRNLERDERDVLSLVVSSGLSYREIAGVTGLSEANVKVKVHRARLKLKKIFTE
ncbi:MAG: sigma-70 family RNA polymerase sigma factor [Desulfobacterales bacterium]